MKMNKLSKRKAFTLIELLIVIAIIGILFIVLVSKIDFATDKAKATGVQTDFRSFQLAFETVSRENSGFNTFGWDTGDANQDGIRNSYDEGDNGAGGGTAKNGIQDGAEVFTGHKVYAETFNKVFSLKKAKADGTLETNYDREALNRLEAAINANLDPKLHITIKDDGEIVMANGAQDPWNKEYHGWYITNAETDKADRGAIVMYSDGANNEFGSEHTIANGIVSISIPGSNKNGKDDYGMAVVYTYTNGYGEIQRVTSGFSNNQIMNGGNVGGENNNVPGNTPVTPDVPDDPDDDIENTKAGLYKSGTNYTEQIYTWQELLDKNIVLVYGGEVGAGDGREVPDDLPDMNAYGFYFDTRYECWGEEWIFHADGSVETYYDGELSDSLPSGSAIYSARSIEIPDWYYSITISDDGYYFEIEDLVCQYYCTKLMCEGDLWLPNDDSINAIASGGFYGITNLTDIKMFDNIVRIGDYAFSETGLVDITLPNSVQTIGEGVFSYCSLLKKVTMTDSVTSMGEYCFHYDDNLIEVRLSDNLTLIPINTFEYCENLEKVNIPSRITSIGNYAFCYCYKLQDVVLPNTLREIGDRAFYNCQTITTINIPNVTNIVWDSFAECDNLESVTLGSNVKSIAYGAFSGCDKLKYINLPDSIETIEEYAFAYCKELEHINIPDSLTVLSNDIFRHCDKLNNIVLPDGLKTIEHQVFLNCTSLTNIIIPENVTKIGSSAFSGCTALNNIIIPDSVTTIENQVFRGCTNLVSVVWGSGLKTIPQYTFSECTNLQSVQLKGQITHIYKYAFQNCSSLESLVLPTTLSYIDNYVFEGCSNLTINYCGTQAQWNSMMKNTYWFVGYKKLVYEYQA